MESRLSLDKEIDVPFALLDVAPWNPKGELHGSYKNGLIGSLDYFGIRDRLKIWPNPQKKGRYYVLNGNKRLNIIEEHLLDNKIREHFKLADDCSASTLKDIRENHENQKVIEKLRKSLPACPIKCQVMTHLDSDTPLKSSDAKLFSLVYDRNHAKYDEVKQADIYREIRAEQIASISEESRKAFEQRLKAMVRPELPTVEPRANDSSSNGVQPAFAFAGPGDFTPTTDEPWGPNPPQSVSSAGSNSSPDQFVPLVFSLTREGYQSITSSCLRSRSRIFREHTLRRSLEKLEQITALSTLDDDIDSIIVETALKLIDIRIKALEESNEKSPVAS